MFGEPVGTVLRTGEHERLLQDAALEQFHEQCRLQVLWDRIHGLCDAHCGRRLTLQVDRHRILEHLAGQRANRRGHGGAEKERLSLRRNVAEDAFDIGQKSHVEHAIGFVQHQMLEATQLCIRAGRMIE